MSEKLLKIINFKDLTIKDSENKNNISNINEKNIITLTQSIKWHLAKIRSGSANTKLMKEISGTTKKPYKQKGTGNARQGSKRSTQFVGGRACHGPRSRSFEYSLPRKIVKNALNIAIRSKLNDGKLIICENDNNVELKTSNFAKFFTKNKIDSALVISNDSSENLAKSLSNIKNIKYATFNSINSFDIIRYNYLIIEKVLYNNNVAKNI